MKHGCMTDITKQLSVAAAAVLEALPNHFDFQGPSAAALAQTISALADDVEGLVQALWGFNADHRR